MRGRPTAADLEDLGYCEAFPVAVNPAVRTELRDQTFRAEVAGTRCLLDLPLVRDAAISLGRDLVSRQLLPAGALAIQAIAFNKTVETNWKVTWHQDLMFPCARRVVSSGYELPTVKDGVHYARPPVEVLQELHIARLHLDDCDASNGPLRVSPGTHRCGILSVNAVAGLVANRGEYVCCAKEGEALLMSPLLLHASSKASAPRNRRVLHLVFHSGRPLSEAWHRAIPLLN